MTETIAIDFMTLPKVYNYVILLVLLTIGITIKEFSKKSVKASSKRPKQDLSNPNKNRVYGQWTPESFKTPIPTPFENWDFEKTRPLPYRAFKHKYNITMGIRNMDWNNWIELDNEWTKYHNAKVDRVAKYDDKLYETTKEAIPAAYECLSELRQFLCHRYPTLFKQTEFGIDNLKTGESFKFLGKYETFKGKGTNTGEDPSLIMAKLLQDDIAIMMEQPDGQYKLKGGAIILPGFWRFRDKFDLNLSDIHTTGDVPKYKEKLQSGMEKFFIRLTCDKPVVRNNYFLQTDDELGWSSSIGNEEVEKVGWYTAPEAKEVAKIHLRSERQSLRRLPKTGAIIFTIRTYFIPIVELVKEPYIPRRLLNGILSWEPDVQEYRGYNKFKDILLPYLEEKAEQQEKLGYLPEEGPNLFPF